MIYFVNFSSFVIGRLQEPNGSFKATANGSENDVRFVYCAIAICSLLNDFSHINIEKSLEYIKSCFTYEGAFSLVPMAESHGGSTYCSLSSLKLIEEGISRILNKSEIQSAKYWCVQRQIGGFQGRCNKDEDSCYSFWISGSLLALDCFDDIDHKLAASFLLNECQVNKIIGGFSKYPEYVYEPSPNPPDILHSFYSIAFLAFAKRYYDAKYSEIGSEGGEKGVDNEDEEELQLWRQLKSLQDFDATYAICTSRITNFKSRYGK
jgi:geranylgeranyl transferase type-1 subunit beta